MKISSYTTAGTPQPEAADQTIQRIKMNVNRTTPSRFQPPGQAALEAGSNPESPILTPGEAPAVQETTEPLSPQLADLARQRRAFQKEKQAWEAERAKASSPEGAITREAILKDPLKVMLDSGVTWEQLTDAVTASMQNPEISALKAEIKELREGTEKRFTDSATQQETEALSAMEVDARALVADGETYELVRETDSVPTVMALIKKVWTEEKRVLDVEDALAIVEEDLLEQHVKAASRAKVKAKLTPTEQTPKQQPAREMKTLTARDTARPVLDKKQRALNAFFR